ncbi:hypothetical protein Q0M94_10730 [Deinococcus radiomollis]|uniref:hypothetical protein n=1 Tax=Deinococcus radiomollis TaxID=468916 RepID=UPI0038923FDE
MAISLPIGLSVSSQRLVNNLLTGVYTILHLRALQLDGQVSHLHFFEEDSSPFRIGWRLRLLEVQNGFSRSDIIEWAFIEEQETSSEQNHVRQIVRIISLSELMSNQSGWEDRMNQRSLKISTILSRYPDRKTPLNRRLRIVRFFIHSYHNFSNIEEPLFTNKRAPIFSKKSKGAGLTIIKAAFTYEAPFRNPYTDARNGSGTRWIDLKVKSDLPSRLEIPSQNRRFRN